MECFTRTVVAKGILVEDSFLTSTEVIELAKTIIFSFLYHWRVVFWLRIICPQIMTVNNFTKVWNGVIHEIIPEDFFDIYPNILGKIWCVEDKTSTIPSLHDFVDTHSLVINSMTIAEWFYPLIINTLRKILHFPHWKTASLLVFVWGYLMNSFLVTF